MEKLRDFFGGLNSCTKDDDAFHYVAGSRRLFPVVTGMLSDALGIEISGETTCVEGCRDYLFFSREHGFVLRVSHDVSEGYLPVFERMHGFLASPIGWGTLEGDVHFFLYPGEVLLENTSLKQNWPDFHFNHYHLIPSFNKMNFESHGYSVYDLGSRNMGVIESSAGLLPMPIDTDCLYFDEHTALNDVIDDNETRFNALRQEGLNPGQAYARVALEAARGVEYEWTPLRHQDLRNAFFEAWPGAHDGVIDVDPGKMRQFLHMCKKKVDKPRYVQKHYWTHRINEKGVKIWRKHVSPAEREQLHPSWKKPTKAMSRL